MGFGRERLEAISEQRTIGALTIQRGLPNYKGKCMVEVRCECGTTFSVQWASVKSGNTKSCGCLRDLKVNAALGSGKKFGAVEVLKEVPHEKRGKRVLCRCVCGKEWVTRFDSLMSGATTSCGCLRGAERRGKVSNRKPLELGKRYGKLTVFKETKVAVSSRRRVLAVCDCGNTLDVLIGSLRDGRTRSCGCITESQPEEEVYKYILSLVDDVDVIRHDRTILEGQELDIFVPTLNLAVEFNGLRFHSEKFKKNSYHLSKTRRCGERGVFLLHVWEDDWAFRTTQVKEKIKSLVGKVDDRTFARKTKLGHPSKTDKKLFYDNTHIQGSCGSSIDIGLYEDTRLVACMSFVEKKDKVWELVRYATSLGVVGGFSKLLSHFKKTNDWEKIISFADLAWSKGGLYEKTGWVKDKILKPDYKYVRYRHRHHKFGFRHKSLKKKLKTYNPNLSEHQNMLNNGIYRIYDCGKIRYILENKDVSG